MTHWLHILLVDDDPGHLELIARALTREGREVEVKTATTCADAIAQLSRFQFDLVLTDFNLDDGQADELLQYIRKQRLTCPAVVVSGSEEQDVVVRSMRSGSIDFLHKNDAIESDRLWNRLDAVLHEHGNRVRERRKIERRVTQLERLVTLDPLTQLANRRAVDAFFNDGERHMLDRRGDCIFLMIDIDHFKHINDTHGHDCGDFVLREASRILRKSSREHDVLARWGGEELLACRQDTTLAVGVRWAESVRAAIQRANWKWEGTDFGVTVSIGVHAEPCSDVEPAAITCADRALYYAKRHGRNRVRTSRHAVFSEMLENIRGRDPRDALKVLLSRANRHLGPTQREHLTQHSSQVGALVGRIAYELKLDDKLCRRLELAGHLHDLGKFCVPENVLAKSCSLDADERILVNRHAEDGGELASLLGADDMTTAFIHHHHDRYDAIEKTKESNADKATEALGGQVIHVADALATITTDRPYQPARSVAYAIDELHRERGKQFSPHVVDAAINHLACPT